jgi:hypothetical protein
MNRKPQATVLNSQRFRLIGSEGLGNPRSRVAQSMAYFQDALYLGVTHPRGAGPDDRARILRYDPRQAVWKTVFISPLTESDSRAFARDVLRQRAPRQSSADAVPLYRGFHGVTVFQGRSDPAPALYVSTICHWGVDLLRSLDGEHFEAVPLTGLDTRLLLSFRTLLGYGRKLFIAPTGAVNEQEFDRNFSGDPTIYVTDDPLNGVWQPAMEPGFGDPGNRTITALASFANQLYAATGNPERGFQLWKTSARGKPPYRWQSVLRDGAGRYNLNALAPALTVFQDALYVATGLPGLGYDSANDVGPAAAELLRVYPDDRWELVVGEPRFSPTGLKVPFAVQGPGFDDFYNSVFWCMTTHYGSLYIGTLHWEVFECALMDQPLQGGFQLWASDNGDQWQAVATAGFGDPFHAGIRTLLSTPVGLFVGSSQEISRRRQRQGPIRAVGSDGCAVWLGA